VALHRAILQSSVTTETEIILNIGAGGHVRCHDAVSHNRPCRVACTTKRDGNPATPNILPPSRAGAGAAASVAMRLNDNHWKPAVTLAHGSVPRQATASDDMLNIVVIRLGDELSTVNHPPVSTCIGCASSAGLTAPPP
jgi:hypothetical protein